jgi:hypothetical protein
MAFIKQQNLKALAKCLKQKFFNSRSYDADHPMLQPFRSIIFALRYSKRRKKMGEMKKQVQEEKEGDEQF